MAGILHLGGYHEAAAQVRLADTSDRPGSSRAVRKFLAAAGRVSGQARQSGLVESMLRLRPADRKRHALPGRLVVSLASYPGRYATLHYTLRCLLDQSVTADRTVLWIAHQDRPSLPANVLDLQEQGLEIRFCEDLRSYNKILPILKEEPAAFIVTADDDVCYCADWLEQLVGQAIRHPGRIIAFRARRISLNAQGLPGPYRQWKMARQWDWKKWRWRNAAGPAPERVFPTGVGGVLYPPRALDIETGRLRKITALSPLADDVGLYWIWRGNGRLAQLVDGERFHVALWPGSQVQTLMTANIDQGGNDEQVSRLIADFGTHVLRPASMEGVIEVRTRSGHRMLVDPTDRIGRQIRRRGLYDAEGIALLAPVLALLQPRTILDVGANIGNHALAWAGQCARLYAFEPGSRALALLKYNVAANALTNIVALDFGLSDSRAMHTLYVHTRGNLGASSLHNRHEGAQEETVAVMTGDEFLASVGEQDVDFIKIDIEGHERQAFVGLKQTLSRCRPVVLTEWSAESSERGWIKNAPLMHELFTDYRIFALIRGTDPGYWSGRSCGRARRALRRIRFGNKRRVLIPLDPARPAPDSARDLLLVPREKLHCLARSEIFPCEGHPGPPKLYRGTASPQWPATRSDPSC